MYQAYKIDIKLHTYLQKVAFLIGRKVYALKKKKVSLEEQSTLFKSEHGLIKGKSMLGMYAHYFELCTTYPLFLRCDLSFTEIGKRSKRLKVFLDNCLNASYVMQFKDLKNYPSYEDPTAFIPLSSANDEE